MWHFLFDRFLLWVNLIKFEFLIFLRLSQTLGKSTLGLLEAEKLAGSGGKNHPITLRETDFRAKARKT